MNVISINPIPLNFDLSFSILSKMSMIYSDYAYIYVVLPQIVIVQLRKTNRIFKQREYILTHIVCN